MATPTERDHFIFLGTGTSSCVPNIHCLTESVPDCQVCISANTPVFEPLPPNYYRDCDDTTMPVGDAGPPRLRYSKNRRRNTSGVYRYLHSDGNFRNVVIDAGKTFYSAVLEHFVYYKLRKIDALLLTHLHADAILGLDDLRQFTLKGIVQDSISVYCSRDTFEAVKTAFPYLTKSSEATGSGLVPSIQWNIFDGQFVLFDELTVSPLSVHHGLGKDGVTPFICWGFRIRDLGYISDASFIPEETRDLIRGCAVLILDSLSDSIKDVGLLSHFSVSQAIEEILLLDTLERAYLTGFCHSLDHESVNEMLKAESRLQEQGLRVRAAFDGLLLEL
ncbi:MAG: hypothetical protein SGCHY_002300 [Lobulomycetales sp.]